MKESVLSRSNMPGGGVVGLMLVGTTLGAADGTEGTPGAGIPGRGGLGAAPGIGGFGADPNPGRGGTEPAGLGGATGAGGTGEAPAWGGPACPGPVKGLTTGLAEGVEPGTGGFFSSKASNNPEAGLDAAGGGVTGPGEGGAGMPGRGGFGAVEPGAGTPKPGGGGKPWPGGGLRPGAETDGTFPEIRASSIPPGAACGEPAEAVEPAGTGAPGADGAAGFGAAAGPGGGGGLGNPIEGVTPGAAVFGAPMPPGGMMAGALGGSVGEGATEGPAAGMAGAAAFFALVAKVKSNRVPGSAFSATAPPPWAARMVLTRANLSPVPASWGDAGCLGS